MVFSFQYWKQIEHFGLDGQQPAWFISLLQRLVELSGKTQSSIRQDRREQEGLRYHAIDWNNTNTPIRRRDLFWLPTEYRDNDVEFPMMQFSISTALGRIAGFWEQDVFNIVLLDPHHNLQPTADFNYRLKLGRPVENEHELLVAQLARITGQSHNCSAAHCSTREAIRTLNFRQENISVLYIDPEYCEAAKEMVESGKATLASLLELGILQKKIELDTASGAENKS